MSIRLPLVDPVSARPRRPLVPVQLRCTDGDWLAFDLLADTGSDVCIIPIEWVVEYGLEMRLEDNPVRTFRASTGADGYAFRGSVGIRLDGRQRHWPCLFSLPSGISEEQARGALDELSLASLRSGTGHGGTTAAFHPPSVEAWSRLSFPDQALRTGILGRRGFLDDFELRITSDHLVILRRSWVRDGARSFLASLIAFLRRED